MKIELVAARRDVKWLRRWFGHLAARETLRKDPALPVRVQPRIKPPAEACQLRGPVEAA